MATVHPIDPSGTAHRERWLSFSRPIVVDDDATAAATPAEQELLLHARHGPPELEVLEADPLRALPPVVGAVIAGWPIAERSLGSHRSRSGIGPAGPMIDRITLAGVVSSPRLGGAPFRIWADELVE